MPRYDDWLYGRVGRGPYDERFRADRWGYYGGGSRYWGPPPTPGGGRPRYGFDYGRGYDRMAGYDRRGGYAGGLFARGLGYRNDPYQPEWDPPRTGYAERGRGRAYRHRYDLGW